MYGFLRAFFFLPHPGGEGEGKGGFLLSFLLPHPGGEGKKIRFCLLLRSPPLYPPPLSHLLWRAVFWFPLVFGGL